MLLWFWAPYGTTRGVSIKINGYAIGSLLWKKNQNRPLPSSKNSHFQNEAKCKTFAVKMSFIWMRITVVFMSMASHLASLWNRGLGQLGNGLLNFMPPHKLAFWNKRASRGSSFGCGVKKLAFSTVEFALSSHLRSTSACKWPLSGDRPFSRGLSLIKINLSKTSLYFETSTQWEKHYWSTIHCQLLSRTVLFFFHRILQNNEAKPSGYQCIKCLVAA